MSKIVDQGVATCPHHCGGDAPYKLEETDDGRLDSVVSCPRCGSFRIEGIDEHHS
jgi:hypothetical protein